MARKLFRIVISLALMTGLLAVFFWNVDIHEVGRALAHAHAGWFIAAIITALASYWLRALRWQLILRPVGKVRHSTAVLAMLVGYAGITLLPARMGDILRPVLLARRDRLPTSAALASTLTERVFDLYTVVVFFLIFLIWPPPMPSLTTQAASHLEFFRLLGWLLAAGLVVATLLLFALFRYQDKLIRILVWPIGKIRAGWSRPVSEFFHHFVDGLRILQRPRDLVWVLLTSIFIWIIIYLQADFTLLAFDIRLPLRASYLLVTLTVLGLALPTPGGAGGFHALLKGGLTGFFGVNVNLATGVAIAYHAVCFYPITLLGLICIPLFGLSLKTDIEEDET